MQGSKVYILYVYLTKYAGIVLCMYVYACLYAYVHVTIGVRKERKSITVREHTYHPPLHCVNSGG